MISDELLEQASAYVLEALGDAERGDFEAAMVGNSELRREVRELHEVTGLLALAVRPLQPPAALRERVVAGARQVRPIAPRLAAASERSATAAAADVAPSPWRVRSILPWLAVAASLAGAVVMRNLYREEGEARLALARDNDSLRVALGARDSVLSALLAPDVATAKLVSTGQPPSARLYWNRASGQVVFAAFSLPPAPGGRTYQLWGIGAGKGSAPVSLGTFNTGAGGDVHLTARAPAGLQIAVGAVTEEPAGGSSQPTTTPFLVGQIGGL